MVDSFQDNKSKLANNANRSVLSLTSPAKLNILSSSWSKTGSDNKITKKPLRRATSLNTSQTRPSAYARPKLNMGTPAMVRRNSSFFKDDERPNSQQQDGEEPHADRFIPTVQGNSQNKVDPLALQEELPPPNASPTTHLRAQTKMVFKQTVAEACGLDMNQKILQYMPQPPVASLKRQSYSMKRRTHYNYQQHPQQQQQSQHELMKLRKINTNPERILDAPGFQDDFYLNLLSWSQKNVLAIALETALYLWNGTSGDVTMLVDYETTMITSVTWSDDDCHISIGKDDGNTEIWDVETMSLVRTMRSGLGVRIGSQSWLETLVATGARSGEIQINDVRIRQHVVSTWDEHTGEVCGLSFKNDGLQLASGGNDNTVMIWDTRVSMPQWIKRSHTAAVKAVSWCPYVNNLLATGGGQTDKHIHFWNTTTGSKVSSISTGSQVSSLHWGQSYSQPGSSSMNREIVATGGNPGNAVSVYNYDTRFKVAEIVHAHESRICCSQLSPDGTTVATVGGDENLKFYKVFEPRRARKSKTSAEDVISLFGRSSSTLDDEYHMVVQDDEREDASLAAKRRTSEFLIR